LKRLPDKPLVLAPRGEFSKGAIDIRAWKKRPYVWMARLLGLYRHLTWQASSEHELGDIRRVMGNASGTIVVAPDLAAPVSVDGSEALLEERQQGAALRVVFLSRITRMKNLDFALNVLGKTRAPVEFDIYGMVDDDRHWAQCQEQIARLPANITVSCHGAIPHSAVASTLGKYDLFFFPTRGENFGHVILEALSAGLPALISDQTPWRDLDQENVGFVRPLEDESGFVEVIETLASLDTTDLRSLRQRARAYAQRHADDSKTRTSNRELFQDLVPDVRR
jgi:glycosyltransferase involved in cell wall biosynthesis